MFSSQVPVAVLDLVYVKVSGAKRYRLRLLPSPREGTVSVALSAQYPERLKLIPLDVTQEVSVRSAFQLVSRQTPSLDLLVNNAGVKYDETDFEKVTADSLRAHVGHCKRSTTEGIVYFSLMDREFGVLILAFRRVFRPSSARTMCILRISAV